MRVKSMKMGGAESFEHVQKPSTAIQGHVSSPNGMYKVLRRVYIRPVYDQTQIIFECQMYIYTNA